MPEMDGLEACRRIRALPGGGLPIIALTANALAGERERCLAAGMDGYLTKPLEPEALCAELRRWLRSAADVIDAPAMAPATVAVAPALPGFDAVKVLRWLSQAPDAWRSMVQTFAAEYPATATAIVAALEAGDRTLAGNLLHRLRGAAGALGAEELAAAAGRLELSLASDGPVDADLRGHFFASAAATVAALAALETPAVESASQGNTAPGSEEQRQRLRELEALIEAGNTRALDHVPWLEGWVRAKAPSEGRELLRQIEALDFTAALETLRGLQEAAFANHR
jgi:two-component system sensor histidine kinase/response regulator